MHTKKNRGRSPIGLQWFVDHALSKGGKCLSTEYKNQNQKLKFECEHGHQFEGMAKNIRNLGTWCPECAGVKTLDLQWFVDHAQSKGGQCLSTKYNSVRKKLSFKCVHSHQWEATGFSVRTQGSWCPECSPKALVGLQWFIDHAIAKGGKCLSDEYINAQQKLTFECAHGHQWEATGLSVRNQGTWCPECAGRKKKGSLEQQNKPKEAS